ncbi:MAG: TetR/AcrR family transcriptional regulator [Oscillospiraceae bacterium]|nr:TetR/AcrR family transcriptional regulator [Clostridia bacterium]MBQ9167389.1 TetR/AcrR family transcriptional regulator [Oscillospiraceae bacterium]
MRTELESKEILRLSNEESNKLTRECLRTAIFKLMEQKSFDKITITDIAKRAGVSRTAFYRNYATKEALVEDLCQRMLEELTASVKSELFRTNRRQWYQNFFQVIQENSVFFRAYVKANLRFSNGTVTELIHPSSTMQEHYRNVAGEGAFISILTEWFLTGMTQTPEEMGEICEALFS